MTGGKGAQFPGHRIPMAAPYDCEGAEKPQHCHKYFLQYSAFGFARSQVRTQGAPNLLLAPGATSPRYAPAPAKFHFSPQTLKPDCGPVFPM